MGTDSSKTNDHNPKFEVKEKKSVIKVDTTHLLEQNNEWKMSKVLKNSSFRDRDEQSEHSNSDTISLMTENLFFKTRTRLNSDSSRSESSTSLKSRKNLEFTGSSKLNIYKPSKINLLN